MYRRIAWLVPLVLCGCMGPRPEADKLSLSDQLSIAAGAGELDRATAISKKIFEREDVSLRTFEMVRDIYIHKNQHAGSIVAIEAEMDKVARLPRDDQARLHQFLAVDYFETGKGEKAIEHFKKAMELSPSNRKIQNDYAYILCETGGDLNKALSMAKVGLEYEPNHPSTNDTYAWILFKKGAMAEAIPRIERALTLDKKSPQPNPEIYLHAGVIFEKAGRKADAVANYKIAISSGLMDSKTVRTAKEMLKALDLKAYADATRLPSSKGSSKGF